VVATSPVMTVIRMIFS